MDAVLKVIGMEGKWTDGSTWNAGSCAIEHEGTKFNATLGWETSDEQVQRCVDKSTLYLLPEPIDLGDVPLQEWIRDKAPYIMGYHLAHQNRGERERVYRDVFLELALREIPAVARAEFDAPKHKTARWVLFRTHSEFKRFGRVQAELCLGRLSDTPEGELWKWHNPIHLAWGCDPFNSEVRELSLLAARSLRTHVRDRVEMPDEAQSYTDTKD